MDIKAIPLRQLALAGILAATTLVLPTSTSLAQQPAREKIGEVLGKPVFRDELRGGDDEALSTELRPLLAVPLLEAYKAEHRDEITPTAREIDFAVQYFRKEHDEKMKQDGEKLRSELAELEKRLQQPDLDQTERRRGEAQKMGVEMRLRPPERFVAEYNVGQWKFQRHLYDKFSGGRVLFQQAGLEAFDAQHEWLKQQEKEGKLRIDDERLRTLFYAYWTTMNHGAFLTSDKERIREFLNPPWAQPAETQPATRPSDRKPKGP